MKSENTIPFSRRDLIGHLAKKIEDRGTRESFLAFCSKVEAFYHGKFHGELEKWKASYAPLDPDGSTTAIPGISPLVDERSAETTLAGISKVLVSANYREITKDRMEEAFARASPWGLQLKVDLDDYDLLALYGRGEYLDSSEKRTLLFRKKYEYAVFRHVALVFKLKADFRSRSDGEAKSQVKYRSDRVYLKLFKNVPTVDLEMLFPDRDIQVKLFDKLKVILPLAIGIISSLYKIVGYILGHGTTQQLWTQVGFWALVGGLFGVALKGFFSYRNTVEKYLRSLTESLYFQNLDNNSGVFKYLVDDAEEEECKELVLGYFFLARDPLRTYREEELDAEIEAYFREELKTELDFEVDDSLRKLRELGLLEDSPEGLRALPLSQANVVLEREWQRLALGRDARDSELR